MKERKLAQEMSEKLLKIKSHVMILLLFVDGRTFR